MKVSVRYACRRLPSVIVYAVLLRSIARLSTSEVGVLSGWRKQSSPA